MFCQSKTSFWPHKMYFYYFPTVVYMYPKHVVMLDVLIFLSIKLILLLLFDMFCTLCIHRGFMAEARWRLSVTSPVSQNVEEDIRNGSSWICCEFVRWSTWKTKTNEREASLEVSRERCASSPEATSAGRRGLFAFQREQTAATAAGATLCGHTHKKKEEGWSKRDREATAWATTRHPPYPSGKEPGESIWNYPSHSSGPILADLQEADSRLLCRLNRCASIWNHAQTGWLGFKKICTFSSCAVGWDWFRFVPAVVTPPSLALTDIDFLTSLTRF